MNPKHLIPGLGNPQTAKRLRDLEKRAATLPVLFALFFSESIKIAALQFPAYGPGTRFDIATMLVLSLICAILYVYEIDVDDIVE